MNTAWLDSENGFIVQLAGSTALMHHLMLQRPVQSPFRTTLQCHIITGPFFLLVSYIVLHTSPLHLFILVSKTYLLYVHPLDQR